MQQVIDREGKEKQAISPKRTKLLSTRLFYSYDISKRSEEDDNSILEKRKGSGWNFSICCNILHTGLKILDKKHYSFCTQLP